MSGGLCGRLLLLLLLIVKPSKSFIFGESILSLSIELLAVNWFPFRWCVKCLKFCELNGDRLPADRSATVNASRLSCVLSFRLIEPFCWLCWCCCCTAAAVVSVCSIWLWLYASSFIDCCWFGIWLLFSSCMKQNFPKIWIPLSPVLHDICTYLDIDAIDFGEECVQFEWILGQLTQYVFGVIAQRIQCTQITWAASDLLALLIGICCRYGILYSMDGQNQILFMFIRGANGASVNYLQTCRYVY